MGGGKGTFPLMTGLDSPINKKLLNGATNMVNKEIDYLFGTGDTLSKRFNSKDEGEDDIEAVTGSSGSIKKVYSKKDVKR